MLRISLVQMNCEKSAVRRNLDAISSYLAEAKDRKVDVIGFPEMSITGYADPTKYPQAVVRLDGDFPGGGFVFAPDGRCLAETPDGRQG